MLSAVWALFCLMVGAIIYTAESIFAWILNVEADIAPTPMRLVSWFIRAELWVTGLAKQPFGSFIQNRYPRLWQRTRFLFATRTYTARRSKKRGRRKS